VMGYPMTSKLARQVAKERLCLASWCTGKGKGWKRARDRFVIGAVWALLEVRAGSTVVYDDLFCEDVYRAGIP